MLADRKVKFAPDMDGYALPNALHWLLLPLSKRTVRLCEYWHRTIFFCSNTMCGHTCVSIAIAMCRMYLVLRACKC